MSAIADATTLAAGTMEYSPVRLATAKDLAHLPGDLGLPILGISIQAALHFDRTMLGIYEKYGPIAKTNLFFQPGVIVNGPDNVNRIQLNLEDEFSNWVGYSNTVAEWFGKSVLVRDLEDHRLHRRIVLAAFSAKAMRFYAEKSNEIVDQTLEKWGRTKSIIALPHVRDMLVHIAGKIFYGLDDIAVGSDELTQAFLAMLNGMSTLVKWNSWPFKYGKGMKGKKFVRDYLRSLIPLRQSADGNDLMTNMVRASQDDEPPTLSEDELLDHLSLLFFAGYDTTTATLLHMLMHLGMDQDLQQRLREESLTLGVEALSFSDLTRAEGLHHTFQETLRLYPALPFTLRGTVKDCELGGHRIPAHTQLYIPSIVNHTLPAYWEKPWSFDPWRFSKGREEHKRDQGAHYYPFGGGAHKCVGMRFAEMNAKIFVHKLLLKYRFRTPHNYSPRMIKLPMPRPADDLPLFVEKL